GASTLPITVELPILSTAAQARVRLQLLWLTTRASIPRPTRGTAKMPAGRREVPAALHTDAHPPKSVRTDVRSVSDVSHHRVVVAGSIPATSAASRGPSQSEVTMRPVVSINRTRPAICL